MALGLFGKQLQVRMDDGWPCKEDPIRGSFHIYIPKQIH